MVTEEAQNISCMVYDIIYTRYCVHIPLLGALVCSHGARCGMYTVLAWDALSACGMVACVFVHVSSYVCVCMCECACACVCVCVCVVPLSPQDPHNHTRVSHTPSASAALLKRRSRADKVESYVRRLNYKVWAPVLPKGTPQEHETLVRSCLQGNPFLRPTFESVIDGLGRLLSSAQAEGAL